jgi:hypothetical protein
MRVRREIMALPAEDRLDYAIDLLEELVGDNVQTVNRIRLHFGVPTLPAIIADALSRNAGRVMARDALWMVTRGQRDADADPKGLDVAVCKLRAAGMTIRTVWGVGYVMDAPLDVPGDAPRDAPRPVVVLGNRYASRMPWTGEEDAALMQMAESGSELWAMADEFERSERAILLRLKFLRGKP